MDDTLLWGLSEDAAQEDLQLETQYLQQRGWTIAPHKIQGPASEVS